MFSLTSKLTTKNFNFLNRTFIKTALETIKTRRSCRGFDPDRTVPKEVINEVLEAALNTPSAMNTQPWKVKVNSNKESNRRLGKSCFEVIKSQFPILEKRKEEYDVSEPIFYDAPTVLYVYKNTKTALDAYGDFDVGSFVVNILNGFDSIGVDTIPIGLVKHTPNLVEKEIKTEKNEEFVIAVSVGYSKDTYQPSKKPIKHNLIKWL
ncbi:nad(p)h nitroreductase ydgi-related [Anaeramoeba flamelloides]|uniref:Nad(P)h nitroreductase ydgi-related n=1 Tax=Anaeramoeba flamelloides TaxID=1746091 RepID=A0AAV7ZLU8_9EUKA|nr:nad(p)h nitroreductase ydgi-related [Anaeramoeba flamelloides]